jgi:hypothetical protein
MTGTDRQSHNARIPLGSTSGKAPAHRFVALQHAQSRT